MEVIIGILVIIILGLLCYLFVLKKELKRIGNDLDEVLMHDSNQLLHKKLVSKEIDTLLVKINSMVTRVRGKEIGLERKNNYLKKEITNITHDLRTPLTSSLGYIDIIMKSDISKEEQIKELKIVQNRLLRLQELVSAFFELSMVTASNEKVEYAQTNLVAVIEECMSHYYDDFVGRNKTILFEHSKSKCLFYSNADMLKRIIDNLIGNALKHSDSDLHITLTAGDEISLSFSNTVVDDSIDTEHIFDEFYTSDISRTKGNTGLGLAMAKQFTEILGGKISANLSDNKLTIEITFSGK
ncbi:MAG: HAMP domain-containing histidine kinase [Lachnospiraceae bacterium]|nr:HAMP domain-containing histidine kinase [Lachnospiraceae bacterium]